MRETYELFSWESVQNGRTDPQEFRTTSPQFSRKSDPNVFVFDQEQARTIADHFVSGVVSNPKTRRHLVAQFHD